MAAKIKLAVVIGGHPYDVPSFRELWNGMADCDVYIQDLDNWASSKADGVHGTYDAFLFYNMNYWGVLSVRDDMDKKITETIAQIGESEQGVVVLHHALLSFTDNKAYSDLCGIEMRKIRGFGMEDIRTQIVEPNHPITRGLAGWTMRDEFFVVDPPGAGSTALLTTDNPKSMKPLAWVRTRGKARVFCYQSGHGPTAYTNASFRKVLAGGIAWVAGRT